MSIVCISQISCLERVVLYCFRPSSCYSIFFHNSKCSKGFFLFPLPSFYSFWCSLENIGRWIISNFICASPLLSMIPQKKMERIIDTGQGAKGWTRSIIKQYFHMGEWRASSYHCSLMFFRKTHLHLKAYFKSRFFSASIFSKILDYALDIEINFFFYIYSDTFSFVDAKYYGIKVRMRWTSKKCWLKQCKNWSFFAPAPRRQEEEWPWRDLHSWLVVGAVEKKRYKVAWPGRRSATPKNMLLGILGIQARLLK